MVANYSRCISFFERYKNEYLNAYDLLFNNCAQVVCDAIDYCNYGFRLYYLNRIWYRIPSISMPFLKAKNGEIINDFERLKTAIKASAEAILLTLR